MTLDTNITFHSSQAPAKRLERKRRLPQRLSLVRNQKKLLNRRLLIPCLKKDREILE